MVADYIKRTFDTAEGIMKNPRYVIMNDDNLEKLAKKMKDEGKRPFPKLINSVKDIIKIELVACSINYCFWLGRYDFYPAGGGSNLIYDFVMEAIEPDGPSYLTVDEYDKIFSSILSSGLPMAEQRIHHLCEFEGFCFDEIEVEDWDVNTTLNFILRWLPGFSGDPFLKRAILYIIQLYRQKGLFADEIDKVFVPADYQIPKVLRYDFNALSYAGDLKEKIQHHELIPENSQMELEIRASTIIACRKLSELTGWNASDVDSWLWLRRKQVDEPFHLTITTNY